VSSEKLQHMQDVVINNPWRFTVSRMIGTLSNDFAQPRVPDV